VVFLAQHLKYSVKDDVAVVVFDSPGKVRHFFAVRFIFVCVCVFFYLFIYVSVLVTHST